MNIVICGSIDFAKEMIEIERKLREQNHKVIVPANTSKYAKGDMDSENKWEEMQFDAIKSYFNEIKKSDAILVVNKDKGKTKNYMGGNSLIEMAFAYVLDKKIFLLNPVPKLSYSDEIKAMDPVIIKGDLSKIE